MTLGTAEKGNYIILIDPWFNLRLDPFDMQFDLYLFFPTATVIG